MLTVLATCLILIIALLAVPVSLTFNIFWQQAFQGDLRLHWLFGLVRLRLSAFEPRSPVAEGETQANKVHASRNRQQLSAFVQQKSFRQRMMRFIRDCWRAIRKRDVRLHVRIGLGDPADTGLLWAIVGPVAGLLSNNREASIEIVPEFIDETFALNSSGNLRLVPLQIICLAAGLLLSPSVWRGITQMRAADE